MHDAASPPLTAATKVSRYRGREFPDALENIAELCRYQLGEIICQQDDPIDYWFRLAEGAARKSVVMADGRRHIVSFLLPGDLFGFAPLRAHQFSVEAISPRMVVARYSRLHAELLAQSNSDVARKVREAAFDPVARLQARMFLLVRNGALEKVAAFLLQMMKYSGPAGVIELPMSRYDIADYLAIAVETVSRSFTIMRSMGLITLSGTRRVNIVDSVALRKMAGTFNGP